MYVYTANGDNTERGVRLLLGGLNELLANLWGDVLPDGMGRGKSDAFMSIL
ncbi:MAG: hypothetical protein KDD89_01335 [Anaerolineales bacterium]|nr:hypothetical protein [Anaerolineales bacterium]